MLHSQPHAFMLHAKPLSQMCPPHIFFVFFVAPIRAPVFAPTACHEFFIFIILNSAWILKILLIFLRFFYARIYFLKFVFFILNSALIF